MTTEKLNLATGITTAEARVLQDKYGKNELTPQKRESFIKISVGISLLPKRLML